MLMKEMRVQDAVGQTLCHDVPRIVRGQKLDPLFRRGHVVTREDVQPMLDSGNANVFIWEPSPGMLHENEAAAMLYGICRSEYMHAAEIEEGMVQLIADTDGVLLVERDRLNAINAVYNACGVRIYEIPGTPDKILAGLKAIEEGREYKPATYDYGSDFDEILDDIRMNPVTDKRGMTKEEIEAEIASGGH